MTFHPKDNQKGSASFAIFAGALFLAFVLFSLFLFIRFKADHRATETAKIAAQEIRVTKLQEEFSRLCLALDGIEARRNKQKYLEVVGLAEKKLLEIDRWWDRKAEGQKGAMDGMMSGVTEYYESRFNKADKLKMLSEKYGLPEPRLRRLKADLEIMFTEELSQKFGGQEDTSGAQGKDEKKEDAAGPLKTKS